MNSGWRCRYRQRVPPPQYPNSFKFFRECSRGCLSVIINAHNISVKQKTRSADTRLAVTKSVTDGRRVPLAILYFQYTGRILKKLQLNFCDLTRLYRLRLKNYYIHICMCVFKNVNYIFDSLLQNYLHVFCIVYSVGCEIYYFYITIYYCFIVISISTLLLLFWQLILISINI